MGKSKYRLAILLILVGTLICQILGLSFGSAMNDIDMLVGPNGHLYVAVFDKSRIQEFDSSGTLIRCWGAEGLSKGKFFMMSGIAISGKGEIYVSDSMNRVQIFSGQGNLLRTWQQLPMRVIAKTIAVNFRGTNAYMIADDAILRLDANGRPVGKFGPRGRGAGIFRLPVAVAVGSRDMVYVVDSLAARVFRFDSLGRLKGSWGSRGKGRLSRPTDVAVGNDGYIYTLDGDRIVKYNSTGDYVRDWELIDTNEFCDVNIGYADSIAVNAKGEIYVALKAGSSVADGIWKLGTEGKLLARWKYK